MSHAIEYLTEYPLSWKDLEVLTDDEKAFLALVSFAVTELNVMMRVCIFSEQSQEHNEPIDIAILTQRYVTLRVWSAKLFEFFKFIKGINNSKLRGPLKGIVKDAMEEFQSLKDHESYELVKSLRNSVTNHLDFKAVKDNLEHVCSTANCNLYGHDQDENSFFPMGEQVVFGARFSRFGENREPVDRGWPQIKEWMDWNCEATKVVRCIHMRVLEDLVEAKFPDKRARRKDHWISPKLAGGASEHGVPVFLRRDS